jgi:putative chitinase
MVLKLGSNGEDVKKLQTKLGLNADGIFGLGTEASVKEWQAVNNLDTDGIVGDSTWTKMFGTLVTTSTFKLDKLKGHVPDAVIAQITDTATKFGITNTLRLAHFLAQCGHESGGFKSVFENLNYSADVLVKIFPKYFNTLTAAEYAHKPEKIANKVYSARMGNDIEASGDGFKFRGRGYIQLTGKDNYSKFDKTVDDDILTNPDIVATKYPLASAAFFFNSNYLWSICDKGADDLTVTAVTKKVNGGIIGLSDRIKHFKEYYSLIS